MEHVYGRETLTKTRQEKKKKKLDPNKHQIKNLKKDTGKRAVGIRELLEGSRKQT